MSSPVSYFKHPLAESAPVPTTLFEKHNYTIQPGASEASTFNVPRLFDKVTGVHGQHLLHSEMVTSTQTLLFDVNDHLPTGLVYVCDVQTSGKGRGSNVWTSPVGCLMFSFKSSFKHGHTLPFLQYIISLAIVQGIKSFPQAASLPTQIKWPNDIYVNKTIKICGIICQSNFNDGLFHVISGVGLNLDNDEPTTCINTLLREQGQPPIAREDLLAAILNAYESLYRTFNSDSPGWFDSFHEQYLAHWLHSGQQVKIDLRRTHQAMQKQNDSEDPEFRTVVIKGLAKTGALLSTDVETGAMYELYPDGNTFDFFDGLITKKL